MASHENSSLRRTSGVETLASQLTVASTSRALVGILQNRELLTDAGESGGVTGGDGTILGQGGGASLPDASATDPYSQTKCMAGRVRIEIRRDWQP